LGPRGEEVTGGDEGNGQRETGSDGPPCRPLHFPFQVKRKKKKKGGRIEKIWKPPLPKERGEKEEKSNVTVNNARHRRQFLHHTRKEKSTKKRKDHHRSLPLKGTAPPNGTRKKKEKKKGARRSPTRSLFSTPFRGQEKKGRKKREEAA